MNSRYFGKIQSWRDMILGALFPFNLCLSKKLCIPLHIDFSRNKEPFA